MVVPDRQLSLAIGKEGQNARLAAKLTGWRIDIKSASAFEAERLAEAKIVTEVEEEAPAVEAIQAEVPAVLEPALVSAESGVAEPLPALDTQFIPAEVELQVKVDKPEIRFAEDILPPRPPKPGAKSKKKKKKATHEREGAEDGARSRKQRRGVEIFEEEEEY